MKTKILACSFWLLFSLYLCAASFRLGIGTGNRPGPGFFPFYAALLLGVIALFRLLKILQETPVTATHPSGTPTEWKKVVWVVAGMLAYVFLLQPAGFVISTFLLVTFFLKVVAAQRWLATLCFALSVALMAHLFFDVLVGRAAAQGHSDLVKTKPWRRFISSPRVLSVPPPR
jgi:putative tricarboxylic transport membrane protein